MRNIQNKTNSNRVTNSEDIYYMVPRGWLETISESQSTILALLQNKKSESNENLGEYVSEAEAKKMLGRKTTWFWQMRTNSQLPFSKVGNKVFYRKSDLFKLVDSKHSNSNHKSQNNV